MKINSETRKTIIKKGFERKLIQSANNMFVIHGLYIFLSNSFYGVTNDNNNTEKY